MASDYDFLFKLVVIGDSSVGKTALSIRFCKGTYRNNYVSTVGLDLTKKIVEVDGVRCNLHIWDTAGQERFRTITAGYYREAHGVMFVYDITNAASFANIKRWIADVERHTANSPTSKIIVGNKSDLDDERRVETATGKAFATSLDIPFFETSASSGLNVDLAFTVLTKNIYNRVKSMAEEAIDELPEDIPVELTEQNPNPHRHNVCC